ncbi:MAG: thiamine pyrophosphate-binding protein [Anaerolineaceae bacterium]|nr:thiamine pyrophosphate-binding protein [Anaerolineaceae bacterium]
MNMAEAIAGALRDAGIQRVYGLPGGENVEVLEALRRIGMDFVLVHNESSALYMAAAAARLEGRPAVCLTTLGPGLANAIAGLGHAWLDRAPLLLLTAQVPDALAGRHTHQLIDQQALTRPLTKAARALRPGEDTRRIVHDLLRRAVSGRPGPVHLQVSRALAAAPALSPASSQGFSLPVAAAPCLTDLERAKSLWRGARRPLVLAGLGIDLQGCHDEMLALAEASQAPVIVTPKAKGVIASGHPLAAGTIGLTRADPVYELLEEADCLLAAGFDAVELVRPWEALTPRPLSRPGGREPFPEGEGDSSATGENTDTQCVVEGGSHSGSLPDISKVTLPEGRAPATERERIGVRAEHPPLIWLAPWDNEDPRLPAAASFTGDMAPVIQELTRAKHDAALTPRPLSRPGGREPFPQGEGEKELPWGAARLARFRETLARRRFPAPEKGRMSPRNLLAALRRAAPPDTPLAVDVGSHKILASLEWPDARPRRFFLSNGLSCMGYGLPAAIGASLALGRAPALCITGDAGMAMVLGELELVTRLGAPVVTVVMNDGALDLIRLAQLRAGAPAWGTEFGNPDFAQIAAAYGIPALRSGDLEECESAVREALGAGQALLVDALIDPAGYCLPG